MAANHTKRRGDRESYKTALTSYNNEIRKANWSSWKEYCQGIENVPYRARHTRTMGRAGCDLLNYLVAHIHNLENKP